MKRPRAVPHTHRPVYRVVRAGWSDPLDATFSRRAADNRWNTAAFAALYCCCGPGIARAVTRDVLRFAGVEVEDLQPAYRPRLVAVGWAGEVVDALTPGGLAAAGLPATYPEGVAKSLTRELAAGWRAAGAEGVVARSASLWRQGFTAWTADCAATGELALFVANCRTPPALLGQSDDLGWLAPGAAGI
jgi:RES domain-containing protein